MPYAIIEGNHLAGQTLAACGCCRLSPALSSAADVSGLPGFISTLSPPEREPRAQTTPSRAPNSKNIADMVCIPGSW
jgi:hypothetical protein